MNEPAAYRVITKARLQLMLQEPYLASAITRYPISECRARADIPTMATDGFRVLYNPKFVVEESLSNIKFVLAHEVFHCLLGHIDRRGERKPDIWNVATDLAVNSLLFDPVALRYG